MKFPVNVNKINVKEFNLKPVPGIFGDKDIGSFVCIRPCAEEYEDKTYLGIYLGDMPVSIDCDYNEGNQELSIKTGMTNPAIFVPDLKTIIFGVESWWQRITTESQLRSITDIDIENVWYVKALKQIASEEQS